MIDNLQIKFGVSSKPTNKVKLGNRDQIKISSAIVRNTEKTVFGNKEVMSAIKKLASE
ncbi:hypothetical protein [Latilactobacillus sakei]|uniref:hypothetical protein n=1 Tax=Latilactobacillus sakei TaxID=1599 RepID=UPI000DC6453F|nr:hypothetical protein [Latilactobacillus sakei]SPS04242.1 hypothetical protein LAS9624_01081 [Latilactobacillus sakei]